MNDFGPPQGRKRSGDFGHGGGSFSDDGGFRKRQRFDDDSASAGPKSATLRVLIRNADAGGIIGKGGENIKRLRKQYDSQVVLPDSAGAPERVMTIMGLLDNCVGVLADVLTGIAEGKFSAWNLFKLASYGKFGFSRPDIDGNKDPRSTHSKDPNRREVQILIPQPFMGTIIGTQGSKIKELRTRTNANIKIFSDPMPGSNERSVQLIGNIDQISDCVHHFLDEVNKKDPRDPIYLYEPGNVEGPPPPGPPPMDMRFPPRGGGGGGVGRGGGGGGGGNGGSFRGGRGGRMNDGGSWRDNGGARGGGNRGRGGRGGRGGSRFNGSSSGEGFQFGSQNSGPPFQGGGRGSNVGYGGGNPNPPNVGYSGNQPAAGAPSPSQPSSVSYPQQGSGSSSGSTYPPPLVPPSGGSTPSTQSQQVTIPAEFADAIIGVGGSNLQQIKTQSSCDIVLEPLKPGTSQRIITITGTSNGIQFAQQLMQNSVRQQHPHV